MELKKTQENIFSINEKLKNSYKMIENLKEEKNNQEKNFQKDSAALLNKILKYEEENNRQLAIIKNLAQEAEKNKLNFEEKVKEITKENSELKEKFHKQSQNMSLNSLKKENTELKNKISGLEKQNKIIETQKNAKTRELATFKKKIENYEILLKKNESSIEHKNYEKTALQEKNFLTESNLESCKGDNFDSQKNSYINDPTIENLLSNESLGNEKNNFYIQIEGVSEDLKETNQKLEFLTVILRQKENLTLKQKLDDSLAEIKLLNIEKNCIMSEIKTFHNDFEVLESQKRKLEEDKKNLFSELQQALELTQKNPIKESSKKNLDYVKKTEKLLESFEEEKKKHEETMKSLLEFEKIHQECLSENLKLKKEIDYKNNEINDLKIKNQ